ncbi:FH1/FH2 domain-containing protein 1 isoform X3 [Rhinoraja longicauda]
MATVACRVQYLDDVDAFVCTNFPEPRRPPVHCLYETLPLVAQLAGIHRALNAPLQLEDCALQIGPNGNYLDLELSLDEQRDDLEGFFEEIGKGRRPTLILRTQLSIRVHAIIEKLYNSKGPDLRRSLFSLKQLFQDDKDLVPEFVNAEGLACLIKVGAEADQNYQNYILRALSQIMLFVDGMNGVIGHNETVQWLYTLTGSMHRLVVKAVLKHLLVFVEYTESNAVLLIQAANVVDEKRCTKNWTSLVEILEEKNGADSELLVFTMTLINKTLGALPDQDSFYDVTDCLEQLGMENIIQRHMCNKGTDPDVKQQFTIYENALKHEDGEEDGHMTTSRRDRRKLTPNGDDGRKNKRSSGQNMAELSPTRAAEASPHNPPPEGMAMGPNTPTTHDIKSSTVISIHPKQSEDQTQSAITPTTPAASARDLHLPSPNQVEASTGDCSYSSHYVAASMTFPSRPRAVSQTSDASSPRPTVQNLYSSISKSELLNTSSENTTVKAGPGERSIFKNRFLENLVATQRERDVNKSCLHHVMPTSMDRSSDVEVLSEKEQQNEALNEREACSASSSSSTSSTLEREEREDRQAGDNKTAGHCLLRQSSLDQCSAISSDKRFMLDMLYAKSEPSSLQVTQEEVPTVSEKTLSEEALVESTETLIKRFSRQDIHQNVESPKKSAIESIPGNVKATLERFAEPQIKVLKEQFSIDAELNEKNGEKSPIIMPLKKDSEYMWDQLEASPRELKIKDLDFTDLRDEEDTDVLDADSCAANKHAAPLPRGSTVQHVSPPPPPPPPPPLPPGCPPPPPPPPPSPGQVPSPPPPPPPPSSNLSPPHGTDSAFSKKRKTVKLFWKELKPPEGPFRSCKFGRGTVWASLDKVTVDTTKLEHLFESKAKELPTKKGADAKKQGLIILDPKRSNAINIGLTVLPPIHIIKNAILNFDEYAINKEGIEKILTMVPTEEEKQKIQEAQLANPGVPLGPAEQFLLALSSINGIKARLQLWAFKLDYEVMEKEIAEPLFDLKLGMEQLAKNKTFKSVLATLLAIGNFLNNTSAKGFELSYLEKVSEVKDTIQRQSLLYHTCNLVVEKFPDTTDVYSEIAAITRSAKVDFDQLAECLVQLERKCKASWDHLKVIAKHETKPVLKNKMTEFLKDSTERILILKVVHRRIINRFHTFLLYLGHPSPTARQMKITSFCKIISEFALEYRTTRERVMQQKQKRAAYRERNKTRGKMITETARFSTAAGGTDISLTPDLPDQQQQQADEEHENMKNILATPEPQTRRSRGNRSVGRISPPNLSASKDGAASPADDATDEIMDRLVKSVTQNPNQRPSTPKERKRSRANRKSLRRTLKSGLTPDVVQALGLSKTSEVEV